jgi:prepilin-type N-terminal cleavage/methylation domain-containing protein
MAGRISRRLTHRNCESGIASARGFSLIELLIGMTIMAVALLSIATMFSTGYTDVSHGGRTTMAAAAARQIIEDMQNLPFANLINLNNFDTNNPASLPAANPERDVARKWRYALAGPGAGWPAYSAAEQQQWSMLTSGLGPGVGVSLGVAGQIAVTSPGGSPTLRQVTVTVNLPGRTGVAVPVQLVTLITRL